MKEFNHTEAILKEFWKQRIKLLVITIGAGVITFGATFLITPLYKSTSIVFPVNIYPASEESPTEQLMQYFNSHDVKWAVAEKFHLFEHYGIDTTKDEGGKALFDYMYKSFVNISPTLYESIEISVKDKSANYAQQINGGILAITNHMVKNNKRYILKQYLENLNTTLEMQNKSIDSVVNLANKLIMDEPEGSAPKSPEKKMKKIKVKEYENKVKYMTKAYGRTLHKRNKFYADFVGDLTFFSIVSHPTIADKRCYPVRSLFAITGSLSALLLAMGVIMVNYRLRLKKNA